ncbi:nucleotide exchange factor GrpE [Martelella mediterranea]|uniref:Protein GrpE n=1 Tax=Martelella mediterranea DSM 17316 TaxID=1122214 RepID=A0A1U9Z6I2_9HYPH|nr:nucleotide exchange factor GrpE [Martelella mediterranea]AQZ53230.1 Heat shock protein B25.3 [Martelella mediterranea DSM 17316]
MTDETKKNGTDEQIKETVLDLEAEMDAAAAEDIAEEAQPEPDPLEVLKAENEKQRDQLLRLAAEMENLRRRTARDVKDAKAYAVTAFARDMLGVSDNLRRALDAIPEDKRTEEIKGFIEGVEMTERSMLSGLERHGVKKIEAEGARFDPNIHQAMFEVPNPEIPANTVVQVVQAGYMIGERVLRPAMVGVSKGGPKPEAAQPADEAPKDE